MVFKCKMCGGILEISEGQSVVNCAFCGTNQTLPKLANESREALYDRANHFRRNNEFDKAEAMYERILNDDNTDSEAYWSLVLCRYGIEYVADPTAKKRVPTINRAQFTSIFNDENYKLAIQYADALQKEIYESEANAINEIQKGILDISQKEEPFDVFICYKETDRNGRRTPDSVLANELYHQLINEGFRVFFSKITLEDKLGTAYEPYIFAALNSAKVMVVLGTQAEYFQAVWVKNEWSRYLTLVKQSGGKKVLIPAYRDMDPYDLPEEFSHLQAQDMSKLGFMQDLIRGIKKLTVADGPRTVVKETVIAGENMMTAPLLKRVFLFLEDGDWKSADEYCEKVLDIEPESGEAYLGKMMCALKVTNKADLSNCLEPFTGNPYYQKAMRFGDENLKKLLNEALTIIDNRILEKRYLAAKQCMDGATDTWGFKEAARKLQALADYKDAAELAEVCLQKEKEFANEIAYAKAIATLETTISGNKYKQALGTLKFLGDYKDALTLKDTYKRQWEESKVRAFENWHNMEEISRQIHNMTIDIDRVTVELDTREKDVAAKTDMLKKVQSAEEQIQKIRHTLGEIHAKQTDAQTRMSQLGIFSGAERRKLKAEMEQLAYFREQFVQDEKKASNIIQNLGSSVGIAASLEAARAEIKEMRIKLEAMNKQVTAMWEDIDPILSQVLDRQSIAVLAEDEHILSSMLENDVIVDAIKHDPELRDAITSLDSFSSLPMERQICLVKQRKQDEDAAYYTYYHACQAMDHARNIDDIHWAKNEFALILKYKDAEKRYKKCEDMIRRGVY